MKVKRIINGSKTAIVYKSVFSGYGMIDDIYKLELFCPFDFTDRKIRLHNGNRKPLFRNLYLLNILGFIYSAFMCLTYGLLMGLILLINPVLELLEDYKDIRYKGMEFSSKLIWFLLALFGIYNLIF